MNIFFPAPSSVEDGNHYSIIKRLVDAKLLQVVLFTGPPGCGTTATSKSGHKTVGSHININQPGMFSRAGYIQNIAGNTKRFFLSDRDRNAQIWRRVYDQISAYFVQLSKLGRTPSHANPILLSANETTHLTLFGKEVEQWKSLAENRVIMSIRDPVLQMRSALLKILDNIDTDIFSDHINLHTHGCFNQNSIQSEHFNISRNDDVREFSVHGTPLLNLTKLETLINNKIISEESKGKLLWPETYRYIKSSNDFALLNNTALKRFAIYNPLLEEPEVQKDIWHTALDHKDYEHAARTYQGIKMEDFHKLPDYLSDTLFRWRIGWMPTLIHLQNNSFPDLIVSEYTYMQNNAQHSWDTILSKLQSRGLWLKDTNLHLPYNICADQQCELPWKAWFLGQDHKTVHEHQHITKPRNNPIPEIQLPACLQALLPEAKEAYRLAMSYDHVVGQVNVLSPDLEQA